MKGPTPYAAMAPIAQYRIVNARDEIALARTAAPQSISGKAEVLVLGIRGYDIAVKGSNGFVCFVERSWASGFEEPEFWNPKNRSPNCFNPPAARSVLPEYLQRTKSVLAGVTKQQLIERARAAVADHTFQYPEPGSFSLMMSKEGYLGDQAGGPWYPHVMFFVKHGETALWGAGEKGSPIIGQDGLAIESTTLFIPVRRWSDGSSAMPNTVQQTHVHGR
ncbi:MAG: hypothetical protein M3R51_07670 [Candidatus Eremiobacteraeota bacterium]|nr:hypothetical protein [Candidatus Eremiobacteraeota bacterium]